MPEAVKNCPLCGSPKNKLFDRRLFQDHLVMNRVCLNCGLVYQSPRMSKAELDTFYEVEYRKLYQDREGPNSKDLVVQAGRANALLVFIKSYVKEISYHLDIGCSAGILMNKIATTYGCQSAGVEPGKAYREFALSKGLRVHSSLEELCNQIGEVETTDDNQKFDKFDLISMAHVLEHLSNPVKYLIDLRMQYLSPTGFLLIEVPNLYCHDCFEVAHTVSFSPQKAAQTLAAAGYKILTSTVHGHPRSEILPLYITILAQNPKQLSTQRITKEHGVRLQRNYGLFRRRVLTRLLPDKAWIPVDNIAKNIE